LPNSPRVRRARHLRPRQTDLEVERGEDRPGLVGVVSLVGLRRRGVGARIHWFVPRCHRVGCLPRWAIAETPTGSEVGGSANDELAERPSVLTFRFGFLASLRPGVPRGERREVARARSVDVLHSDDGDTVGNRRRHLRLPRDRGPLAGLRLRRGSPRSGRASRQVLVDCSREAHHRPSASATQPAPNPISVVCTQGCPSPRAMPAAASPMADDTRTASRTFDIPQLCGAPEMSRVEGRTSGPGRRERRAR
jgi:hypothetical protein